MVGGCECDTDFDVEVAIKAGFLRTDREFLDLVDFHVPLYFLLRRLAIMKPLTSLTGCNPITRKHVKLRKTKERCRKLDHSRKDIEEDSPKEFDSPPMKMRRISMVKRLKTRTEQASKDNIGSNDGIVAACKELVNLVVSRGSMDDITVMIIDLHHFR
ncbi:hypothetical protein MLD38_003996 [Melastoma candidum]|uniref:Uncharacterized protein n=1 Tax=Melastoma candidum TaxID=119954 RepID=A0ACB9S409_9MYRT|nr:hypothetical protein MLD38_003996 [Melastoma candidum]